MKKNKLRYHFEILCSITAIKLASLRSSLLVLQVVEVKEPSLSSCVTTPFDLRHDSLPCCAHIFKA